MKHKILSILLGVTTLMYTACSTDIAPEADSSIGKGNSILRLEIEKQDMTRGVITSTSFEKGDTVFVVVKDKQHPDPLTFTTLAAYDGEKWKLLDDIDLTSETSGVAWTDATVEVYYPYQTFYYAYDSLNPNRIIVANPLNQEDILYGRATGIDKENPTAKISCDHLKTRLTFEIKNNSDNPVGISKMSVTTEGEQLFIGRYGYVQSGYFYVPDEYTQAYSMGCNIEIPAGETANLDLLLPPTEQAYEMMKKRIETEGISKTILKFSLDTGDRTINFDIDTNNWEPGRQYTYPVTYDDKNETEIKYEYVDLGLSVLWATSNIGASSPEEQGKYFFWGDTRGYVPGETYTNETVAFINNKSPEELLSKKIVAGELNSLKLIFPNLVPEYDAATQNMGLPWRMPTSDEINELIKNTKKECYKNGDNWMLKLSSTVQGYEDKYIIIPKQAGLFYGYIDYFYVDSKDDRTFTWWSSTVYDFSNYSFFLYIVWNDGNINDIVCSTTDRTQGLHVRGVRPK